MQDIPLLLNDAFSVAAIPAESDTPQTVTHRVFESDITLNCIPYNNPRSRCDEH